jgi:hypothetical protein
MLVFECCKMHKNCHFVLVHGKQKKQKCSFELHIQLHVIQKRFRSTQKFKFSTYLDKIKARVKKNDASMHPPMCSGISYRPMIYKFMVSM